MRGESHLPARIPSEIWSRDGFYGFDLQNRLFPAINLFIEQSSSDANPSTTGEGGGLVFKFNGKGHDYGVCRTAGHEGAVDAKPVFVTFSRLFCNDLAFELDFDGVEDLFHGLVAGGKVDLAERNLVAAFFTLWGRLLEHFPSVRRESIGRAVDLAVVEALSFEEIERVAV